MNETKTYTGTVVQNPLEGVKTEETSLTTTKEPELTEISLSQLADLGFIAPVASAAVLRAAFDSRQKMIAAILDPRDFMYTVPYVEQGRPKQQVCQTLEEARKWSEKYGTEWKANPKKSGVVKIAVALGITAERMKTSGLPDVPDASYAYCVYKATHTKSGAWAEGVGWCDKVERGGRSTHDLIAMADTRAYCRAVLRLAGLGDVSADEIIAGDMITTGGSPDGISIVDAPQKRISQPLPPLDDVDVMTAARTWASEISQRAPASRYADAAAQDRGNWPMVRAKARRGDVTSAQGLGRNGLRWSGNASDGPEYEGFYVDNSPVSPEDMERVDTAAAAATSATKPAAQPQTQSAPQTQAARPQTQPQTNGGPSHDQLPAVISDAQKVKLTELLIKKLGTKDKAIAWLKESFSIDSTAKMPPSAYEDALRKLNAINGGE